MLGWLGMMLVIGENVVLVEWDVRLVQVDSGLIGKDDEFGGRGCRVCLGGY